MTSTQTTDNNPVISVTQLGMAFGDQAAIQRIDLRVEAGELVAVLGPSGCGKSTLLNILSGLQEPTQGSLSVLGRPMYEGGITPRLGYVFQEHRLLPWRTVEDNLKFVLRATDIPESEWDGIIDELLEMLHISQHKHRWPMWLSGGERQRVSIARALAVRPPFVLMDEPLSTLDEVTARTLRQELVEVWEKTGQTMIYVTHSIREAVFLADRILILSRGPARVFEDFRVPIERPRDYDDPQISQVEAEIVDKVLDVWGIGQTATSEAG